MTRHHQQFRVRVHREDETFWAEIPELPGCFASGDTLDELSASLAEAIGMYLFDSLDGEGEFAEGEGGKPPVAHSMVVEEMTVCV